MPNKKRGVVLLLIKEVLKIGLLVSCIVFVYSCTERAVTLKNGQHDEQLAIFTRAQQYLDDGAYEKAYKLYRYYLETYPATPLADDAAYRLCYLHVMVSDHNPYFNYQSAQKQFQKFIETYKNSRYIIACNNWLGILQKMHAGQQQKYDATVDTKSEMISEQERITQLENENKKLKATLLELQQAIER
jgi:outer membrane protein assembly factor BamD (BamD/ComL family)